MCCTPNILSNGRYHLRICVVVPCCLAVVRRTSDGSRSEVGAPVAVGGSCQLRVGSAPRSARFVGPARRRAPITFADACAGSASVFTDRADVATSACRGTSPIRSALPPDRAAAVPKAWQGSCRWTSSRPASCRMRRHARCMTGAARARVGSPTLGKTRRDRRSRPHTVGRSLAAVATDEALSRGPSDAAAPACPGKVDVIPFEFAEFGATCPGEEPHPNHGDDGRVDERRPVLRLRQMLRLRGGLVDVQGQRGRFGSSGAAPSRPTSSGKKTRSRATSGLVFTSARGFGPSARMPRSSATPTPSTAPR